MFNRLLILSALTLLLIPAGASADAGPIETMGIELAVGGLFGQSDQYLEKIEIFGYEPDDGLFADWPDFHYSFAVTYSPFRHLSLVLTMSSLDGGKYNIEIPQMSGESSKARSRGRPRGTNATTVWS